jgi:4-amino-4-deoxy-L-arabinose transferase-like glycosyltransferase
MLNRFQALRLQVLQNPSWLIYLLLAIVWLSTLGFRHLLPSDEGRYAEIAREMLVSGNWLVPKYNDYLYFEKPPLHMWMTALAFKLFGLGEWQARLWSGLTSLGGIFFFAYTASKVWGPRVGHLTAMILASSPLWILGGHFNSLDMGMAFFMGATLCCLILSWGSTPGSETQQNWMLLCWASMALAVLSKGLIGVVLPGLVIVIYTLTSGDWKCWSHMLWIKGVSLFFLICAPWFILISIEHPSFLHFFFIREHFQRFTTNEHARVAPWHFFLTLLCVGLLPWLVQLVTTNLQILKLRLKLPLNSPTFKVLWLSFVWFVVILIFFSSSHSKLPGYIIPVIPALAIMIAISIDHGLNLSLTKANFFSTPWLWQVGFFLVLFIIGLTQISLIEKTGETYEAQNYLAYAKDIRIALIIGVVGCILSLSYYKRKMLSLGLYSVTFLAVTLTAGLSHEHVGRLLSGVDLAQQVKPLLKPDTKLYSVELLDHTLPFYLEHTSIMVNFEDELAFGIEQEPNKWISKTADWIQAWQSNPSEDAFAILTNHKYDELTKLSFPMQLVARDDLRVIVRKPLP